MGVGAFLGRIGRALARAEEPGPPRLELLWPPFSDTPRRVGLVSGSFDPMTVAHAALAESLRDRADLVLFLYSVRTLPKQEGPGGRAGQPLLSARDRVASLLAYVRLRPGLGVALSSHGLYADQAEGARRAFPEADLIFGVGADKVVQLVDPGWYEDRDAALARLFSLARMAYAAREGEDERLTEALAGAREWGDRFEAITLTPEVAGISSRAVREALSRGRDVQHLVPPEVLPFVRRSETGPPRQG